MANPHMFLRSAAADVKKLDSDVDKVTYMLEKAHLEIWQSASDGLHLASDLPDTAQAVDGVVRDDQQQVKRLDRKVDDALALCEKELDAEQAEREAAQHAIDELKPWLGKAGACFSKMQPSQIRRMWEKKQDAAAQLHRVMLYSPGGAALASQLDDETRQRLSAEGQIILASQVPGSQVPALPASQGPAEGGSQVFVASTERYAAEQEKRAAAAEAELKAARLHVDRLRGVESDLKQRLQDKSASEAKLKRQLEERDKEVERLRKLVDDSHAECGELRVQKATLQVDLDEQREQAQSYKDQVSELTAHSDSVNFEQVYGDLEARCRNAESRADTLEQDLGDAEQQLKAAYGQREQLQQEVDRLKGSHDRLKESGKRLQESEASRMRYKDELVKLHEALERFAEILSGHQPGSIQWKLLLKFAKWLGPEYVAVRPVRALPPSLEWVVRRPWFADTVAVARQDLEGNRLLAMMYCAIRTGKALSAGHVLEMVAALTAEANKAPALNVEVASYLVRESFKAVETEARDSVAAQVCVLAWWQLARALEIADVDFARLMTPQFHGFAVALADDTLFQGVQGLGRAYGHVAFTRLEAGLMLMVDNDAKSITVISDDRMEGVSLYDARVNAPEGVDNVDVPLWQGDLDWWLTKGGA